MRESKSLDLEGQAAWQPWPEAEDGIHSAIPTPAGTPGLASGPSLGDAVAVGTAAVLDNSKPGQGSSRSRDSKRQHKRTDKVVVAVPNPDAAETETLKTPIGATPPASVA